MATLYWFFFVMSILADFAATDRVIKASDLPSGPFNLPSVVCVQTCRTRYCECELEISSANASSPIVSLQFKYSNTDPDLKVSVAEGSCEGERNHRNYTVDWPAPSPYNPCVYIQSENDAIVLSVNQRSHSHRLTFPTSVIAHEFTFVNLTENQGVRIFDIYLFEKCFGYAYQKNWHRVQLSDVIRIRPKRNVTIVSIDVSVTGTKYGCVRAGSYKGEYKVLHEQGWLKLDFNIPNDTNSNVTLTVTDQLIISIPVISGECTENDWYGLSIYDADTIINCNPNIANIAEPLVENKECACKLRSCQICLWLIVTLIVVLVLSGAVSVMVAYLNYRNKKSD